jgi:prophage tail gpP-like protein
MARNALIQIRRDTAANWTSVNPTLAAGEMGFETDTGKFKIGTGSTAWTSLSYATTIPSNTVTSAMIVDGTIVDGDINASAAIAPSKVAGVFITGDSSNNTITISTSSPTGGNDGDVWMVYS